MAINIEHETLLRLSEAAKRVPGRGGGGLHAATIYRWVANGVGGVRLESILIGGCRYTSVEALGRFIKRCNASNPNAVTTPSRQRRVETAERELEAAGI